MHTTLTKLLSSHSSKIAYLFPHLKETLKHNAAFTLDLGESKNSRTYKTTIISPNGYKAKVKKDEQIVLCVRGLSGAGKSTYKRAFLEKNPDFKSVNADTYIEARSKIFSPKLLAPAHLNCQAECARALDAGDSVLVDNTNLTFEEMGSYYRMCHSRGLRMVVVDCLPKDTKDSLIGEKYGRGKDARVKSYNRNKTEHLVRDPDQKLLHATVKPRGRNVSAQVVTRFDLTGVEGGVKLPDLKWSVVPEKMGDAAESACITSLELIRITDVSGNDRSFYKVCIPGVRTYLGPNKLSFGHNMFLLPVRPFRGQNEFISHLKEAHIDRATLVETVNLAAPIYGVTLLTDS